MRHLDLQKKREARRSMWQNIKIYKYIYIYIYIYVHSTRKRKKANNKKAQLKEAHTTSSPKDWLLAPLGPDLRLDCKKEATIHQLKKKEKKKKEKGLEGPKGDLGCDVKGPEEPWAKELTGT